MLTQFLYDVLVTVLLNRRDKYMSGKRRRDWEQPADFWEQTWLVWAESAKETGLYYRTNIEPSRRRGVLTVWVEAWETVDGKPVSRLHRTGREWPNATVERLDALVYNLSLQCVREAAIVLASWPSTP